MHVTEHSFSLSTVNNSCSPKVLTFAILYLEGLSQHIPIPIAILYIVTAVFTLSDPNCFIYNHKCNQDSYFLSISFVRIRDENIPIVYFEYLSFRFLVYEFFSAIRKESVVHISELSNHLFKLDAVSN